VIETDPLAALVTSLLEHYAICFPFSCFFLCSLDSSSDLCEEDARVFFLTSFLVSFELSSVIIRFYLFIEGLNIAFEFKLNLFAAMVEFLLGYLDIGSFFLLCFLPFATLFPVDGFF